MEDQRGKWVWEDSYKISHSHTKKKERVGYDLPTRQARSKAGAHIGVDINNVTLSDTTSVARDFCCRYCFGLALFCVILSCLAKMLLASRGLMFVFSHFSLFLSFFTSF